MHFHFLLQSSQKFSCLPSSLVIDKKCISIFLSSSVITKIFLSSFVVGDGQKMHFHFLLHSSQKISRLPSSLVMDKKCISISFFMKIFPSSIVVGDGQKMHFHLLLQSSQKFSRLPSSVVMNKKCISIFFFTPHITFLVFHRRW